MKLILLINLLIVIFGISIPAQTDERKRREIEDFVIRAGQTFETSKTVFTVTQTRKNKRFEVEEYNFKIKKGEVLTRRFSFTMNGKNVEMLAVYYKTGTVSAEEIYCFKNKQLIYASEEHFLESGGAADSIWRAYFYFSDGKILTEGSNGHGKSEDDEWNSEKEILKMSRTRLSQLNGYLAGKRKK